MSGERDRSGGFSLLEVLATLAIAAATLVALSSFVFLMTRQADRVAAGSQEREVVGQSLDTLARAIERAQRLRWAGPEPRFVFAGTRDTLLFALDRGEGEAPRVVEIRSIAEAGGGVLLWREGAFDPRRRDGMPASFGATQRLPVGGAVLHFAYVTPGTPRRPEILTDDWPAVDAMPEAVRLALTDPRTGAIRSSLRVPLRIGAEPGCLSPRKAPCSRFDERTAPPSDDDAPALGTILGNLPYQVRR
ncbi:prepilin-type N-terminal cleavage/methylation domain-containing protein [Methylobacterium sp. ID0610]|uniref:prepilin-type N-terminal cleavage/methylation domain-containing protein n=1 Tax=Methylobacterium carpenticola TaxID=3344827 RepID=UPI00369A09B9